MVNDPQLGPLHATKIARFGNYIYKQTGRRAFWALGFLLLGSLTEGISIFLLIGILQLMGPEHGELSIRLTIPILADMLGPEVRLGLGPVLILLVLLTTVQALFTRFKNIYMSELLYDVINHLRTSLFESIGRARWRFIARQRSSDLNHLLTADIDRVQNAAFSLFMLIQNCVVLIVYICVSALISPAMTIFAAIVGISALFAIYPIRKYASVYGDLLTDNRQAQYRIVSEFLSGVKIAKSFNSEPRYVAELAGILGRMRRDFGRFVRLDSISGTLFQVSSAIAVAIFVYVALSWFGLSLAKIVVMIFLFMRVSPRIMGLQNHVQGILTSLSAFHAMQVMQETCDHEQESLATPDLPAPSQRYELVHNCNCLDK